MIRAESSEEDTFEGDTKKREITKCPTILKSGLRKNKPCNKPSKHDDGTCGIHYKKDLTKKDGAVSVGTSDARKLYAVPFGGMYVCNVVNSSKDTGNWKTFWLKHSGEDEYPKTCRAKDCERTATATGHMYLRDEYEEAATMHNNTHNTHNNTHGKKLPKHNYLVPICSHHNSPVYDCKTDNPTTNFFVLKRTTIAVKILENKNIHLN